jgi:hypothetical protein
MKHALFFAALTLGCVGIGHTQPDVSTPSVAAKAVSPKAFGQPKKGPAAPGGDANLVWTNTRTKVYHCSGSPYYGHTDQGAYTDESDAVAKGFRSATRKACTL